MQEEKRANLKIAFLGGQSMAAAKSSKNVEFKIKNIDKANEAGRPIGCFISEIIVASDGIIAPPAGFYKDIYK